MALRTTGRGRLYICVDSSVRRRGAPRNVAISASRRWCIRNVIGRQRRRTEVDKTAVTLRAIASTKGTRVVAGVSNRIGAARTTWTRLEAGVTGR